MTPEKTQILIQKYSEIFKPDPPGTKVHTPFHLFTFECDDGWYPLIDGLCRSLMSKVISLRRQIVTFEKKLTEDKSDWSKWMVDCYTREKFEKLKTELEEALKKVPVATQVKEKYGGLCFYRILLF